MLPVCAVAPTCSSQSPIFFHSGASTFCRLRKVIEDRCISEGRFFGREDAIHAQGVKTHAAKCMPSLAVEELDRSSSLDSSIFSAYPNEHDDIVRRLRNDYFGIESEDWSLHVRDVSLSGREVLRDDFVSDAKAMASGYHEKSSYIELISSASAGEDELVNLPNTLGQSSDTLSESTFGPLSATSNMTSGISESPTQVSDTFDVTNKGLSTLKESIEHLLSGINGYIGTSLDRAEGAVKSTYNAINSTASDTLNGMTKSFDSVSSGLFSSVDGVKERSSSGLSGVSSKLVENVSETGTLATVILRRAIVALEDSLGNAATFAVYFYGSAKSLLPLNVRDVLNSSEVKVTGILMPVQAAFQQIYIVIEGFERALGLDPNDPIVPFILFLGSTATIGTSFWLFNYGGYSGDLTPEMTLELLKNEDAVLIDVRPENSRKRDGIPDLRRGARAKYASVISPEVDDSLRKMLKSGKNIDDALTAVVIRNLKIIQGGSRVIVMDDSGGQSKALARSLNKLGVKKTYLVQGGFQSWVKKGLRIKELKPESTFSVLNEEAEALLEDIKPTPTLVIGYCLGIFAAAYALLEWEKTLQVIGIVGLGQTIYRRVASYEDSEDFKQDVRLLLTPIKLGAQAVSSAARTLEPNKIGLPTSPLSMSVQDRVLQAAAKHESQPSDSEEIQGVPRESASENLDLSEA